MSSYRVLYGLICFLVAVAGVEAAMLSVYQIKVRSLESRIKLIDTRMERHWRCMMGVASDLNEHIREDERRRELHRCRCEEAKIKREKRAKKKTASRRRRRRRTGRRAR